MTETLAALTAVDTSREPRTSIAAKTTLWSDLRRKLLGATIVTLLVFAVLAYITG